MRKHIFVILIIILISVIKLCGCVDSVDESNDKLNRFVGTWKGGQVTFIFFSDGTCSYLYGAPATYSIKDDSLVINVEGGAIQTLTYSFSNNDNTLILTNVVVDISFVLTKQ